MSKDKTIKSTVSEPIANNQPDFFEKLGNKGVFIALALILLVAFLVFKDFILLKKLYLYKDIGSDTLNGAYPFFYNFANYVDKYGLPTWSFEEGMGQNIIGGFLRDPFMMIGYLAGPSSMPKIYVFVELIKIISSGIVFYLFLKQLKVSNYAATIGTLAFTFSGFMIIGSCWYVFSYEAFTIALAFLGFELYYQKNKWLVFIISIFAIAVSMPFNLYVTAMFLLFYILFRLGQAGVLTLKSFFQVVLKLAVLGVIGLLLASPFLFEALLQLVESPRGSGGTSYFDTLSSKPMFALIDKFQFGTFITRLFSSDYMGSGINFTGWQNFLEAPVSYCGILSVILMPQIFTSINKSARKWYIIWLLIWLIPTIFPYFRYAFWLFSGDYYRVFSFGISMVFILYSVFALDIILKTRKVNLPALAITVVVCLSLLGFNYYKGTGGKTDTTIAMFVYASLFIYAGLVFFIARPNASPNLKYVLLAFVCIELAFLSSFSINRREIVATAELTQKTGYNDYSIEAVKYIKKNETGFYRIDKNYSSSGAMHGSLNDNKVHDYYATSLYSSFSNMNYIGFLKAYDMVHDGAEHETRWVGGLTNRPILESLNNVKYILAKGISNPMWNSVYDTVARFGDVQVLKSKYSLPFGYTYTEYIKESDFNKLGTNQKDLVSLKAVMLKDEDVPKAAGLKAYNMADTTLNNQFTFENYKADVDQLGKNALKLTSFSDVKINGNITSAEPEIMYLSFPLDKGWHLTLDGKDTQLLKANNGMTGVYLTKGDHTLELNFKLRLFKYGLVLIPIGLLLIVLLVILDRKNKSFMLLKL